MSRARPVSPFAELYSRELAGCLYPVLGIPFVSVNDEPSVPEVVLKIWVHPGRTQEDVRWDVWRRAWVIAVRDPAISGRANRAVEHLLSVRLGVAPSAVSIVTGSQSPLKSVRILGIDPSEAELRLRRRPGT